jgi:DNA-binding LacI/PurR family transcriptional regulator
MNLAEPPTAIFCISDLIAASTIKQAVRDGYSAGKDISVCGFDNILFSSMFVPGITTIEQPCFQIGRTVVEKLIDCMSKSKKSSEHIKLKHKLIERESVGYIN